MTKKLLTVFGTRPEAIKLAPFIHAVRARRDEMSLIVCVTGQHREMLESALNIFDIIPDYDLESMEKGQDLFHIVSDCLMKIKGVIDQEKPDMVVVQGDTSTTFAGALAAYYSKIPIAHIEAGLRTGNKYSPFPEEKNRHLISCLADLHFAPTKWAESNLLKEGIDARSVFVTGNTVIDALLMIQSRLKLRNDLDFQEIFPNINNHRQKMILVTGHRRENFGHGLSEICGALKEIAEKNDDVQIVYAVHLNPNVQEPVHRILDHVDRVHLAPPLDYEMFVYLMNKAYFILTDSGGIQEEAPSLGKPVLVMRDSSERPEGLHAGTVLLVGTQRDAIVRETQKLLKDKRAYQRMAQATNPYGDGTASKQIVNIISQYFQCLREGP